MKKLLNTVYVTTEGASLRKDGENLVAEVEGEEKARVPLHMLAALVVFGPIFVSPALVAVCAAAGITITLLDRNGRFQARVEGPTTGNVLLRRSQYRASERPEDIVRSIIIGKVANQRSVLMRALRDYGGEMDAAGRTAISDVVERLAYILRRVELADDGLDRLRGAEGEAASLYFSVFDTLIRSPDAEMRWTGRSRRPPLDPVNALLSFLYTLLTHDCRSACECADRNLQALEPSADHAPVALHASARIETGLAAIAASLSAPSHSMRVRGSKLAGDRRRDLVAVVALHASARIETTRAAQLGRLAMVALHASARIETRRGRRPPASRCRRTPCECADRNWASSILPSAGNIRRI